MAVALAAAAVLAFAALFATGPVAQAAGTNLVGTFALTPGTCQSGGATGTYFRMVQPSGTVANGPFVSNGDSTCADKTYTLLAPGSDGGVVTGGYQPAPSPAFDAQGNSLATRITVPAVFFGVRFGLSTDPNDRQTGAAVPPLAIQADSAGKLTGDVRAWEATWNKQNFNQGSPKPDGSTPKLTTPAHGTYDAATGAFELEWTSTIVGGPFNEFTGSWHLTGTFRPPGAAAPAAAAAPGQPASRTLTSTASRTKAPAAPGAVTATTTAAGAPAAVDAASAPAEATPGLGGAKVIGAVAKKGWKPPAWSIVLTAVIGICAAAALLLPTGRAATGDTSE
ncbi:MAG: hypothetical protein JO086_13420 [Acidimicrobiia bacterium]|nr:hypothetical protein [Acidimicrobiia bacterium]